MQATPSPADVTDGMRSIAAAVTDRLEEIWTVEVPENGVDLRGVPPGDRHDLVREGFERLDSGEIFVLVSDRDPTQVREFLLEIADEDSLDTFEVKRQNSETWLLRTGRP